MKRTLLLTIISIYGLATVVNAQLPDYVPTNGLAGYWSFDGNADDLSANANDGTINGATSTTDRFNNANSAYYFDGVNDWIEVDHNASLSLNDFTISCWIEGAYIPSADYEHAGIVSKGALGSVHDNNYFLTLHSHREWSSKPGLLIGYEKQTNSDNIMAHEDIDTSTFIGTWFHVVGVFNSSTEKVSLYINNVLVDENTLGNSAPNKNNEPLTIGAFYSNPTSVPTQYGIFFKGKIDDVGIWNRPLTRTEITKLYQGPTSGTGLVKSPSLIKVYPNPASTAINVDLGEYSSITGYSVKINNTLGQTVLEQFIDQKEFSVDLSGVNGKGIYFLQVLDDQNNIVEVKKFVLQ